MNGEAGPKKIGAAALQRAAAVWADERKHGDKAGKQGASLPGWHKQALSIRGINGSVQQQQQQQQQQHLGCVCSSYACSDPHRQPWGRCTQPACGRPAAHGQPSKPTIGLPSDPHRQPWGRCRPPGCGHPAARGTAFGQTPTWAPRIPLPWAAAALPARSKSTAQLFSVHLPPA